jgi:Tfp pilus assembly protein PilZ
MMKKRFSNFDIKKFENHVMLNKFITIASLSHNYALCIEYIKGWFYEKFEHDFFGYTFLDGTHVFREFNNLTKEQIVNHMNNDKPTCSIIPTIDEAYDREKIDLNLFGIEQFVNTTKIDKSFIQDPINNRYVMMKMDMILMNFTFKMKFPTRAMQLDAYKFIKLAFRITLSETKDVATDYLIPYSLMLNIALDSGFEIKDDRIVHPIKFLTYLNQRSFLPIIYKFSNIVGREEYYIRMTHLPVRIGLDSLNKDDGNKTGHLNTDFGIEMNINVRFPGMQLYVYHTKSETNFVPQDKEVYNIGNTLFMALHQMDAPPKVNDRGWIQYIKTDYQADSCTEPLNIDLAELFEGELEKMVKEHKERYISPDVFLEMRLYNDGYEMPITVDWSNMILHCELRHPSKLVSTIVIYMDLEYLNTQRIENFDKNTPRVGYDKK